LGLAARRPDPQNLDLVGLPVRSVVDLALMFTT
jgi:hypothetical protein